MPEPKPAALSDRSWISIGLAGSVLAGVVALYSRVAVLETNSTHANKTLEEMLSTIKGIADRQSGDNEKFGQFEARLTILEQWRQMSDRKADGK